MFCSVGFLLGAVYSIFELGVFSSLEPFDFGNTVLQVLYSFVTMQSDVSECRNGLIAPRIIRTAIAARYVTLDIG